VADFFTKRHISVPSSSLERTFHTPQKIKKPSRSTLNHCHIGYLSIRLLDDCSRPVDGWLSEVNVLLETMHLIILARAFVLQEHVPHTTHYYWCYDHRNRNRDFKW